MPSTYVFGDIHGCNGTLLLLLDKIGPLPPQSILIFLGDYIDRGPQSKEVIETVLALRAKYPHTITLMGNHERMFLDYLAGINQKQYLRFGGLQTLESYGVRQGAELSTLLPATHRRFFNELLLYWEDDDYIYVHAGIDPATPMALQTEQWLLWSREESEGTPNPPHGKTIIYGHTAFKEPKMTPGKIGIDTGAVYGGHLSCLILPENKIIQTKGNQFWPNGD